MQENNLPLTLAERALLQAETVLLRYHLPYGLPSLNKAAALLAILRTVTWRITLHADTPAWKLWQHLESKGIDMEDVIQQTTEFALRFELVVHLPDLARDIANSVNWLSKSRAVPEELRSINGSQDAIIKTLNDNWWLIYLYLLATSSAGLRIQELAAAKPAAIHAQPHAGGNAQ